MAINPQFGLVPIGRNPKSGLWEFAHVESGYVPSVDSHGMASIDEQTSLVFVLVPGGTFLMGAQNSDPMMPNYDPDAEVSGRESESPVHEIRLDPFFISKFEMNQAQWIRLGGKNKSYFNPAREYSLSHPLEQVTWFECDEILREVALLLPTEAQWEYACRAGTNTIWWFGNDIEALRDYANVGGRSTVPVGQYPANPFGLHDTAGNVWEWCRDTEGGYTADVRPGDALRESSGEHNRILRGGWWSWNERRDTRSGNRGNTHPSFGAHAIGMRPVRNLDE